MKKIILLLLLIIIILIMSCRSNRIDVISTIEILYRNGGVSYYKEVYVNTSNDNKSLRIHKSYFSNPILVVPLYEITSITIKYNYKEDLNEQF